MCVLLLPAVQYIRVQATRIECGWLISCARVIHRLKGCIDFGTGGP